MSWTNFFDKIYVINLAKRTDRMQQAIEQLTKYNIPFERWEAIENKDGAEGLRLTMIELFTHCIENNYQNCLIFEDDVDFLEPDMNNIMEDAIEQLPPDYHILYLGAQLCKMPVFYWRNLLIVQDAYATHAAAYSNAAMKEILNSEFKSPIDNFFVKTIQKKGKCFCVYPLIASQIPSHSDIYTATPIMDWRKYIQGKYEFQMQRMKDMGKFIREPKNN